MQIPDLGALRGELTHHLVKLFLGHLLRVRDRLIRKGVELVIFDRDDHRPELVAVDDEHVVIAVLLFGEEFICELDDKAVRFGLLVLVFALAQFDRFVERVQYRAVEIDAAVVGHIAVDVDAVLQIGDLSVPARDDLIFSAACYAGRRGGDGPVFGAQAFAAAGAGVDREIRRHVDRGARNRDRVPHAAVAPGFGVDLMAERFDLSVIAR